MKEGALLRGCHGDCSGSLKERRSINKVSEVHQRLPGFHEDYLGPRNHMPEHH